MTSQKKRPRGSRRRVRKADITDDDEVLTRPPIPPDGGWGYIIVLSSFMISFLLDGVCFSFGVFFTDFMDYFQTSKGKTSWAGSALNGTYLFIGPLVSGLANRYGCRKVTIIGSVVAATALFLSTFSPSIEVLILLYGVMGGIGFGLVYLPAIVMVGYYFDKKRALATGVAVCGSGIGAFAFAPICERLLDIFDWKGALWIISGLVLNGVVCGAFYRPLKPEIIRKKDLSAYEAQMLGVKQTPICKPGRETQNDKSNLLTISPAPNVPDIVVTSSESRDLLDELRAPPTKAKFLGFSDEYISIAPRSASVSVTKRSKYSQARESGSGNLARLARSQDVATLCRLQPEQYNKFLDINDMGRPLYRKDIFYSGSIMHLPEYHVVQEDMSKYITSVTRIPIDEPSRACLRVPRACESIFYDMVDVTLLKSVTFVIYGLSCTIVMLGFFVPFTYVPPLAISLGIDRQQSALLVSILGITNTLGRIISGFLSDRSWADCLLVNNLTLIIAGIITMMAPLYTTYGLLATYCALFGLFISAFVSLRSVIVVDLLGLDKLTNAFGLITLCQGVSAFIGSPIAGTIADATGNYDAAFYLAGACLVMGGVICLPLRRISAWEKAREDTNKDIRTTLAPLMSPENIPMVNVEMA